MRTEKEIRGRIEQVYRKYIKTLNGLPVSLGALPLTAIKQILVIKQLDVLYWCLGKERPQFKCDRKKP